MIWSKVLALISGHLTVFKHSFKKRVTLEYPEIKQNLPERFRGKPNWYPNKCITCKICMKACPADAIVIDKNEDKIEFKIDLSRCIMCGNCMYNCPKDAIVLSHEYELATDDKSELNITLNNKSEAV